MNRALSANALVGADELSVVICAAAGDDNAYSELVRRRQSSIRQLFRRLCRDPALADDLAQQTFLQAWRTINTLKSPAALGAGCDDWPSMSGCSGCARSAISAAPLNSTNYPMMKQYNQRCTNDWTWTARWRPWLPLYACVSPWRMLNT